MHYTGPVYRPPFERSSLLLQVTVGCSHNRCAFCTMYRDVPFRMEPMEQIEQDLLEASVRRPNVKRVFLENGDPFVLSAGHLEQIARMIHTHLPQVRTISMYASIGNIAGKTDAQLRTLRGLGINELNIGVESGLDEALEQMNKGYTAAQAREQLLRLKEAGFDFGANVIFGSAGPALRLENARQTAALLNETKPNLIFTGTIHADPGCPLYERLRDGSFRENTVAEYLEEEEAFVRDLDLENCLYFGVHPSNIAGLYGDVNRDKPELLRTIAQVRGALDDTQLDRVPRRQAEGAVMLL